MSTTEYKTLLKNQTAILKEISQLRRKIALIVSVSSFEDLALKGRKFAKAKRIKKVDVFRGD